MTVTPLLGVGSPSSGQHLTVLLFVEFDLAFSLEFELESKNPELGFVLPVLFIVSTTTMLSFVPAGFVVPVGVATLPPIIITRRLPSFQLSAPPVFLDFFVLYSSNSSSVLHWIHSLYQHHRYNVPINVNPLNSTANGLSSAIDIILYPFERRVFIIPHIDALQPRAH